MERCRIYNESRKDEDRIRAEAYLEGVADAYRDGECGRENIFDFCIAADEAAWMHGHESTCWGLVVGPPTPNPPLTQPKASDAMATNEKERDSPYWIAKVIARLAVNNRGWSEDDLRSHVAELLRDELKSHNIDPTTITKGTPDDD